MTTSKHKHHHNNYDIYGDIGKIKDAFAETATDVRGRAGEMFTDSVDDLRKKSTLVKDNVASYTAEKPFKTLGLNIISGNSNRIFFT